MVAGTCSNAERPLENRRRLTKARSARSFRGARQKQRQQRAGRKGLGGLRRSCWQMGRWRRRRSCGGARSTSCLRRHQTWEGLGSDGRCSRASISTAKKCSADHLLSHLAIWTAGPLDRSEALELESPMCTTTLGESVPPIACSPL